MSNVVGKAAETIRILRAQRKKEDRLPSMLLCPFCDNENFTITGLKYHLENECKIYREVGTRCTEKDCCFFGQIKSHACACRRHP